MSLDKHTLQQWVAGAEVRFRKTRRPLAAIPGISKIAKLATAECEVVVSETIDLTRARDFRVYEGKEDAMFASVDVPVLGKRGIGNDTGIAVATFAYEDREGDIHQLVAVCAYTVSGSLRKSRDLRQVLVIPVG